MLVSVSSHSVDAVLCCSFRHVLDEGADEYKIIMLNKRQLTFRVIKVGELHDRRNVPVGVVALWLKMNLA